MIVVGALVVGRGVDCREPWNLSEVLRSEFIACPLFLLGRLTGSREQHLRSIPLSSYAKEPNPQNASHSTPTMRASP